MTESTRMTPDAAVALRRPFPPESIGKLPKGGQMLDYCGHAAVTDRLLTVDPEWTWDFLAYTSEGLPVTKDSEGNLWIRLTVCGVTRIGVGDGKNAKERIGDAIRNAAMRFGVALDLWAKEDLVEFAQHAAAHQADPAQQKRHDARQATRAQAGQPETGEAMTAKTRGRLFVLFSEAPGIGDDETKQKQFLTDTVEGRTDDDSRSTLTEAQAQAAISRLVAWQKGEPGAAWSPTEGDR